MSKRYQHVLSPIKIGNQVLKIRLSFPHEVNHTLQGTEDFPADPMITFYSELARNGAGLVTITAGNPILPKGQSSKSLGRGYLRSLVLCPTYSLYLRLNIFSHMDI